MKKISKPQRFNFGYCRRFEVRESTAGKRCILLTTSRHKEPGPYLVMYWEGDYLRLDKFLLWMAKAVAWVDRHGYEYDFKSEFKKRNGKYFVERHL